MYLEYCILGKKEVCDALGKMTNRNLWFCFVFQSDNIISTRINFNTDSDVDGRDIWLDFSDDGRLTEIESKISKISTTSSASCVCITSTIEPNSSKTAEFALAWHMPEVKFGLGQKVYSKFERCFD